MHFFYAKLPVGSSLAGRERVFHEGLEAALAQEKPALALLQRTLVALDAPVGTEIHYTVDGTALQDVLGSAGWRTEPCSTTTQRPTGLA